MSRTTQNSSASEGALFSEGLHGLPRSAQPIHLAIGMFDGVHRGHQAVIGSAIQGARLSRGRPAVLTFWPHPSRLFQPQSPVPMISTPEVKQLLLRQVGVDWIIQQPFDAAFAEVEAEEFPAMLVHALPDLQAIYIGENFCFGRGRKGDVSLLVEQEKQLGIQVVSADRLRFYGEPISSTRIRECLVEGRIVEANRMLGYAYFAQGVVVPGKQLGREIGFPTLNLAWNPECRPALGVYRVLVSNAETGDASATPLPAVANFGLRPTVESEEMPQLEVHLLDSMCPWDAGDRLKVEWLEFLRPEKRFESLEALRAQIAQDRDAARGRFSSNL